MGDMDWSHWNTPEARARRQRAKTNQVNYAKKSVPRALEKRGISYQSFNDGLHLRVTLNGRSADLWPSTCKWISTDKSKRGECFNTLLTYLQFSWKQIQKEQS